MAHDDRAARAKSLNLLAGAGGFEPPRMAESKSAALPIFPVRKQAGASAVATPLWHPRRLDHNARRDAPLSFAQFERASLSRGLKGFRSRPPKNEKYPGVSKEQG